MRPFQSRRFILVIVAFAVAAGSLLVAGPALADEVLFRVEQRWHNFPAPPVTTPGGAGMYQRYIQPYYFDAPWVGGGYLDPPATAIVEPGNPVGGAFTLPQSFITYNGFTTATPPTEWPGHFTWKHVSYYNGPGKFEPNHGATGPTRIVFPTTMGNPYPTYTSTYRKWINGNDGDGNPVNPTTTFDGRYDMSRGGSITGTPGPRRFGGTMRLFHGRNARWKQWISYFSPNYYTALVHYICLDEGKFGCTPSTFVSEPGTTAIYEATWYLLTELRRTRATTPTTPYGKAPTPNGNASYLTGMRRYLNLIHPWTTGFAKVHNAKGSPPAKVNWVGTTISPEPITPQAQGYDISLGGATLSVKKYNYRYVFDSTLSTLVPTTTTPYTQILKGVTRVVSMVRPKLVHTFRVSVNPSADPITNVRQFARLHTMKVFFLPEPTGLLLLATGIAAVLGLSRTRRR